MRNAIERNHLKSHVTNKTMALTFYIELVFIGGKQQADPTTNATHMTPCPRSEFGPH